MKKVFPKIQLNFTCSTEVIVAAQESISLPNINMGDVPEDHTKIWVAMGDNTKKLISHGAVLDMLMLMRL